MKTLVSVLSVLLGIWFGLLPAAVTAQANQIDPIQGIVEGTTFRWEPVFPVVPSRGAPGNRAFEVHATITGTDVASFVLYNFDTLRFKPGGGGGGGLGRWSRAPEQYEVWVDGELVTEIGFTHETEKTIRLEKPGPGGNPHEVLAFTVKLLDPLGNTIAEFVDPWDYQP